MGCPCATCNGNNPEPDVPPSKCTGECHRATTSEWQDYGESEADAIRCRFCGEDLCG